MTVRAWFVVLSAGLAACGTPPVHSADTDPAARRAIEAALERYVAATNQGDPQALAELYAEDAVLLPPDHEPIQGREAIGEFWSQGTDPGLEIRTLRLEVDAHIGYLVGRYYLPATSQEPADSGKSVMCLERQRDGSWKLTADIWNSDSGLDYEREGEEGPVPSIT